MIGLLVSGRNCRRDRIGREQHVEPAPRRQMIGIADREIEPDHIVRQRHAGVQRRRAGMVAELRAHPCDPGGARFLDGHLRGALHDQVSHAIVAIEQGRRELLTHDMDVGPDVEAAGLDTAGILRQPADAVSVGSLQIGLRHQRGHGRRIRLRQAQLHHRFLDEGFQPAKGDRYFRCHDVPAARQTIKIAERCIARSTTGVDVIFTNSSRRRPCQAALACPSTRIQFSPTILRTFSGVVIRRSAAIRSG